MRVVCMGKHLPRRRDHALCLHGERRAGDVLTVDLDGHDVVAVGGEERLDQPSTLDLEIVLYLGRQHSAGAGGEADD